MSTLGALGVHAGTRKRMGARVIEVSQRPDARVAARRWRPSALIALLCALLSAASVAAGDPGSAADTTVVATGRTDRAEPPERFVCSPSDTIDSGDFRGRHAFSLDHFFEWWPRFMIGRRGPIGWPADFSRYGIGRGRGVLYLGTVALNDPQDDRVPLGIVPTTAFGTLLGVGGEDRFFPGESSIEGAYRIVEPDPPGERPIVAFDLSKGDRSLRQRRVRLSSVEGPIGIDFEFDELLNDGYAFDARGIVTGEGYGQASTRVAGGNVRGEIRGGVDYLFSLRRFRSVVNGDLFDARAEQRREGHVAVLRSSLGAVDVSVFERSYEASSPDSATENHTTGLAVSVPGSWRGHDFTWGAGYEDIRSHQQVGEEDRSRLEKVHVGAATRTSLPAGISAAIQANATHHLYAATAWGAGVRLSRRLGSRSVALVEAHRRFRMPNLGELFGPRHRLAMDPSFEIAGNRSLNDESAVEGMAAWTARVGALTHEIRATAMRVQDPIAYVRSGAGASLKRPENGDPEDLFLVEDRAYFRQPLFGAVFEIAGSVEYAPGEKTRFFEGVPEYRSTAWAAIGGDLFQKTSAVRLSAEYQYGGRRRSGSVEELPSYDVVNLKFLLRIIDARLYVQWLNLTDEKYQTAWPYLMTPRTFVYGVEWTIFD